MRGEDAKGARNLSFFFHPPSSLSHFDGKKNEKPEKRKKKKKKKKNSSCQNKKTGWTDKQNRPGIDPVDEACHAHDTCYGQAHEANPPSHKIRRAAAECSCDKTLVSALKDFKKNKTQQAAATKAAKRAAGDMEKLFDVKCPIAVAGAVLRPPSPESAPGGKW